MSNREHAGDPATVCSTGEPGTGATGEPGTGGKVGARNGGDTGVAVMEGSQGIAQAGVNGEHGRGSKGERRAWGHA